MNWDFHLSVACDLQDGQRFDHKRNEVVEVIGSAVFFGVCPDGAGVVRLLIL